jgi:hypothetical protein
MGVIIRKIKERPKVAEQPKILIPSRLALD